MSLQLDNPASVIVIMDNVIVADRYGDAVSLYRARDLQATGSNHYSHLTYTPVSLTYFQPSVFVCYRSVLAQYSLKSEDGIEISRMDRKQTISITQICCTTSNYEHLYMGTLKPSLIRMHVDPLSVEQEYKFYPILYTNNRNRYPWLHDMKAGENCVFCLFTGSPSPPQLFSLEGELMSSILTEDQIVGAYHFNLFGNPITDELRIYICDFWDNSIKVFDLGGKFIETICETGHALCQIFRAHLHIYRTIWLYYSW
ncbi:hypothetical protein LOD99_5591 [Oopsacas minuta]|uniref:Uncharacterized protein n=1 Tax=Oopsacas minuta TaxID=111878 RepID=A0AAV7JQ92_9METZ|nr:hypothetical protein LOD99_5591 [Oopsacas minuta]